MPGMITVDDITNIQAKVIATEVLGLASRKYNLRQLCKVIRLDHLIGDVPIATKLVGSTKVPEYVEARISAQSYTKTSFDLWKNVVHVAMSRESQAKANYDILKMHVDDAAREMAKMENDQIATAMDSGTSQAGADWGGTNDPADDVMAAITAIEDAEMGWEADYMAVHPLVYADLVSNAEVKKYMELGTVVATGQLPKFCGLPILRDPGLTNTKAYVIAKNAPAIILGDGPEMVEEYNGGPAFYDGYAIAKFLEPKMIQDDAEIMITGVHA